MASQSCPLHPCALARSGADNVVHSQEKLEEISRDPTGFIKIHTSAASEADETTAFFNL
jgi:hypothetical protein